MAIVNLKGVRSHRHCPRQRAHSHRCYAKDLAIAIADERNEESVFEIYSAFSCKDNRCKKYSCWHVGHLMEHTPPRAAIEQFEAEEASYAEERAGGLLIQYGRLQGSWRPK